MKGLVILFAAVCAGCATTMQMPVDEKGNYVDPNRYSNYGLAMKHTAEQPLGSYWQQENRAAIDAATTPEVLAKFVATPKDADALLAKVKAAYASDPIVLTQIGAVSQFVMCRKCAESPARRSIWVAALERALDGAEDEYRKAFYRDQLRWCGYCQ